MPYPSSLSDEQWEVTKKFFEEFGFSDDNRMYSIRKIVDAVFYLVNNGVKWRELPNDFPPWKTVYYHFSKWAKLMLWEFFNLNIVGLVREKQGRDASPSLLSIDSQSQHAEPGVEKRGLDGNKKINGRKRHIVVDVNGFILACRVTPANEADRIAGESLVEQVNDSKYFPRLQKILGDNAYKGVGKDEIIEITVESETRKPGQKGFVPEAFRWVVERSFAWLNRQRRVARQYEKLCAHQEAMNFIASTRICLKRLQQMDLAMGE